MYEGPAVITFINRYVGQDPDEIVNVVDAKIWWEGPLLMVSCNQEGLKGFTRGALTKVEWDDNSADSRTDNIYFDLISQH